MQIEIIEESDGSLTVNGTGEINIKGKQMNAYELADELENLFNRFLHPHSKFQDFLNAATMLRQQADRIAELEKDTAVNAGGFPVKNATYWKRQADYWELQTKELKKAHPVKQLSDEDIEMFKEIIRITDRKHPLWNKAKEFLGGWFANDVVCFAYVRYEKDYAEIECKQNDDSSCSNLKLTFDNKTGELKSAKVFNESNY